MKKVTAIILAIVLAFIIALGDQIIKLSLSGDPLGIKSIASSIGLADKDSIEIPDKPKIPEVTITEEEEVNLSYNERIEKGNYYYDRGFLTFAANEYVKAANLEPGRTEPYLKLAQANFDLAEYPKASKNAEMILSLDPDNYEARYFLVLTSIKQNDFTKADLLIDELLASGLTDARLTFYKVLLKITLSQYDEGKSLLRELSAVSAMSPDMRDKISTVSAAFEEFEFAQSAEGLYLDELLSRSLNQIGEYEMAIFKLKSILQNRSDLRDAWILLGFSYLNLEKYLFALSAFERAYELDPQSPSTQYFLGLTYSELSRFDDAIIYLNYSLSNGFEPEVVVKQKLADLYLEVEEYEKSVAAYESVLEDNKEDINSFVRPIWMYLDFLEEPIKALKLAELAVITFPEDPMAYNLLGWSQVGTQNYVESEKNLKKAIEMDPEFAAAHYNLGKLYEDQGRSDFAMAQYQKAYELDSNGSIGNLAAKRYNALMIE